MVIHQPGYRWTPTHELPGDGGMFDIPDVGCDECPISAITPRAFELVSIFNRARHAHENSGAALFGPDLSKWPAWAVDALVVIEQESARESNARFEAEQQNREN